MKENYVKQGYLLVGEDEVYQLEYLTDDCQAIPDWLMKDQTCKPEATIKSWFKMGLSTRGSILGTSSLPFCLLSSLPSCLHPFFLSLLVVLIYLNLFIYGCTGSGNTTCTISHLKNKQKLTYILLFWKFSHVSVLVQAFPLVGQISLDW